MVLFFVTYVNIMLMLDLVLNLKIQDLFEFGSNCLYSCQLLHLIILCPPTISKPANNTKVTEMLQDFREAKDK